MREFNSCKKSGMKIQTITDTGGIEACLGADPKGKVAKACNPLTGKILADLNSRCVSAGTDLTVAFAACNNTAAGDVATCIDERIKCRTCLALNAGDNLANDCDLYDNGASDLSCS